MKTIVIGVMLALVAVAAGGYAWYRHVTYAEAKREAANANFELGKARSEITGMRAELDKLRTEAVEQKMAMEQLRAEAGQARSFIEAEKATGARLREELARAREDSAKKAPPKPAPKIPIRPGLSKDTIGAPAQR